MSRARAQAPESLPTLHARVDGPPSTNRWADRDPAAAKRLEAARTVVAELAEFHGMPAENLISPDAVRRLAWSAVEVPTPDGVAAELRRHRAREWQVRLVAEPLAAALAPLAATDEAVGGSPS